MGGCWGTPKRVNPLPCTCEHMVLYRSFLPALVFSQCSWTSPRFDPFGMDSAGQTSACWGKLFQTVKFNPPPFSSQESFTFHIKTQCIMAATQEHLEHSYKYFCSTWQPSQARKKRNQINKTQVVSEMLRKNEGWHRPVAGLRISLWSQRITRQKRHPVLTVGFNN